MSNQLIAGEASKDESAIFALREAAAHGRRLLAQPELPVGLAKIVLGRVRAGFRTIYGSRSEVVSLWPAADVALLSREEARAVLTLRLDQVAKLY